MPREHKYNADWIVWLQFVIIFLLYFTPGSQSDAIPIYVGQLYLLAVVNLNSSANMVRTAAIVLMIVAVAGVVSAFASTVNMTAVTDIFVASVHLGVMFAVAIVMVVSSMHLINTPGV